MRSLNCSLTVNEICSLLYAHQGWHNEYQILKLAKRKHNFRQKIKPICICTECVHQPRHTAGGTCDSDAPARTTRSGPKKYSYNIKREIFGADLKHSFHQQLGSLWRQSVARKSTGVDEFPVYYYYQSDLSILWFPASHHHQEHNGVKLFLKSSYLNLIILKLHRYLFS